MGAEDEQSMGLLPVVVRLWFVVSSGSGPGGGGGGAEISEPHRRGTMRHAGRLNSQMRRRSSAGSLEKR